MRNGYVGRNNQGQAVALPLVMISLVVVGVIGMFSFEIARTALAKEQLQAATEAAALAAGSVLNGSETDPVVKHQKATSAAQRVFRANSLLGTALESATVAPGAATLNQARLQFRFIDKNDNNNTVPQGDPKANAVEVSTTFGLQTVTGNTIGLGDAPVPVNASAIGGSNNLDVVILFDSTASMKDETKLSGVRRFLSGGVVSYQTVFNNRNRIGGSRPQALLQNNGPQSLNGGLRGATDNSLPGNSADTGNAQNTGITDAVVNLDEQFTFGSFSQDGFDFPSVAVLVEASRGNLENEEVFVSSGAATALRGIVTPKEGYQAKYFELALEHTHPLAEAKQAVAAFIDRVKDHGNVRIGLVAYQQQIGQDESTTYSAPNVATGYPAGGQGSFPLPAIQLDPANNKVAECTAALKTITAFSGANTGGAVDRAIRMLETSGRAGSQKAIVLLTDNNPQFGSPFSGDPRGNCQRAGAQAKTKGIAIAAVTLPDAESAIAPMVRASAVGNIHIPVRTYAEVQPAMEFLAARLARTSL